MRIAVLALVVVGCLAPPRDDGYPGGGWGSGFGGGNGWGGYGCQDDAQCTGDHVCARNGECLPPSGVRAARTIWTVRGAEASTTSCANSPKLDITFTAYGSEQIGYSPVPCEAGKFTVDKLPLRFTTVQLTRAGQTYGGATGAFDASGTATLDLPY
jgi:hypothetical protein